MKKVILSIVISIAFLTVANSILADDAIVDELVSMPSETFNQKLDLAEEVWYTNSNGMFKNSIILKNLKLKNKTILKMFDMTRTTMVMFKYPAPRNCLEIFIAGVDGVVRSGCIKSLPAKVVHDLINDAASK